MPEKKINSLGSFLLVLLVLAYAALLLIGPIVSLLNEALKDGAGEILSSLLEPDALEALVPKFLTAVPLDPMGHQTLRYRKRSDSAFVLYSVGIDGKDDGGDPSSSGKPDELLDLWKGRDVVWPTAAPEEEAAISAHRS